MDNEGLKREISGFSISLPKYLKKLEERKPPLNENEKLVLTWIKEQQVEGKKNATLLKRGYMLMRLAGLADRPFNEMNERADVEPLIRAIDREFTNKNTNSDYRRQFKSFHKWLNKTEHYAPAVSWLKRLTIKTQVKRSDLFTTEERDKIIQAEKNVMWRALWALASSSGARIGELLSLRRCDVEDAGDFLRLNVWGYKTKPRIVPLTDWVAPIKQWLKEYPRGDTDALFYSEQVKGEATRFKALSWAAVGKRFKTACGNAGINRRCYPYLLRHTRATEWRAKFKEGIGNYLLGWTPSSRMPEVYDHLGEQDAEEKVLALFYSENKARLSQDELAEKIAVTLLSNPRVMRFAVAEALKNKETAEAVKGFLRQIQAKGLYNFSFKPRASIKKKFQRPKIVSVNVGRRVRLSKNTEDH